MSDAMTFDEIVKSYRQHRQEVLEGLVDYRLHDDLKATISLNPNDWYEFQATLPLEQIMLINVNIGLKLDDADVRMTRDDHSFVTFRLLSHEYFLEQRRIYKRRVSDEYEKS